MGRFKNGLVEENPEYEKIRRDSLQSEGPWRENLNPIHLFITHTFEKRVDWDDAVGKYKDYFKFLSWEKCIGEHLHWFGVGDIQRTRHSNNEGKVPHFHTQVSIDGGLRGLTNPDGSLNSLIWSALKAKLEFKWEHGNIDIKLYDNGGGAIGYGLNDHEFYYEGISCPRKARKCRKGRCSHGNPALETNGRYNDENI